MVSNINLLITNNYFLLVYTKYYALSSLNILINSKLVQCKVKCIPSAKVQSSEIRNITDLIKGKLCTAKVHVQCTMFALCNYLTINELSTQSAKVHVFCSKINLTLKKNNDEN